MDIKYITRTVKNLLLMLPVVCVTPTWAISPNWTGGTSTNWATGANWSGGVAPTALGDTAVFPAGALPAFLPVNSGNLTLDGLNFNAATNSYTVTNGGATTAGLISLVTTGISNTSGVQQNIINNVGSTLTLQNTATITGANIFVTNNGAINIFGITGAGIAIPSLSGTGNSTITIGNKVLTLGAANTNDTLSSVISGADGQILKVGSGTLTLTGNNAYTGTTTVAAGNLQLGSGGVTGSVAGNIVDNAVVIFNRADSINYNAVISGIGSVTKLGSGTLTLSNTNTYTGGTTVSAGNLIIGSNFLGSVVGDIANNANLTFSRSDDTTYAGVISGTGQLIKANSNILTLTGDHTYLGLTQLLRDGGTLQLGNGGVTGSIVGDIEINPNSTFAFNRSDTVTYTGVISGLEGSIRQEGSGTLMLTGNSTQQGTAFIDNGTLQLGNGGSTGILNEPIVDNSNLIFNRSDNVVFPFTISGVGNVTQEGTGTLILTSNDHSFLGSMTISAGALQIGNGGNTGQILSSIVDNAQLIFNRNDTVNVQNFITGTGSLIQNGSGVVVLTVNNTYAGQTIINAGAINIGGDTTSGSVTGDILDNSDLRFARSDNLVYGGVISGAGVVSQLGTGTLTLNGTNTVTGLTTVSSGTLLIGGSSGFSNASVGGDVTVNTGATLGGFGEIGGSLTNNGTVSPGASIGTLTVSGNYLQSPAGTMTVEVNSAGQSDLLQVNGTATVAGTLSLNASAGFTLNQAYTFLTATGGISGQFSNVNGLGQFTQHFIQGLVTYNATSAQVSASFNQAALLAAAHNANQRALVNYLIATGGTSQLRALFASMTTDQQLEDTAGDVIGAVYANQQLQIAQTGSWFERQISDRMGPSLAGCAANMNGRTDRNMDTCAGEYNVWVTPYGSGSTIDGKDSAPELQTSQGGLAVGIDMALAPGAKMGIAAAATYFSSDAGSSIDASDNGTLFQVGIYGDYQVDQWTFGAGVDVGGTSDIDTTRNDTSGQFTSSYTATLVSEQVKATYDVMLKRGMHVRPFVGIVNQTLSPDSFTETAPPAGSAISVNSETYSSLKSQVGTGFDVPMSDNMTFLMSAAWQHEFQDNQQTFDVTLGTNTTLIPVEGTAIGQDSALVKAGVVLMRKDAVNITALYEGVFADSYMDNGGKLQVNFVLE